MDWTDRWCRRFHRRLSVRARLYTEMVTTGAILFGDQARHLDFDTAEHPVALQLGGSEPRALAQAASIGRRWGYDEINLNCGCPSDRVQNGAFGACLMKRPDVVSAGCAAIADAIGAPATVKHRIGVDDQDGYGPLRDFVGAVAAGGGVRVFILHARKAWLNGLSPKENRTVPPLRYDLAAQLRREFPDLTIVLNGGIDDLTAAAAHLADGFDGVMVGRAAYQDPWLLAGVDGALFGADDRTPDRWAVAAAMADLVDAEAIPVWSVARHMMGLFNGLPGARRWRRALSDAEKSGGGDVIRRAADAVPPPRSAEAA
ncbi:MAG: tRNA dihydrouridine(20/20a) synthase DusA [Pseudomonadota bacterium]